MPDLSKYCIRICPFSVILDYATPHLGEKQKSRTIAAPFFLAQTRLFGRLDAFRHTTNHRRQNWYGLFQLYLQINYSMVFCECWLLLPARWLTARRLAHNLASASRLAGELCAWGHSLLARTKFTGQGDTMLTGFLWGCRPQKSCEKCRVES